jgi:hypothetical protein
MTAGGFTCRKEPSIHYIVGWVGSIDGMDVIKKRNIFAPAEIQTSDLPASCYTDYAIPAGVLN